MVKPKPSIKKFDRDPNNPNPLNHCQSTVRLTAKKARISKMIQQFKADYQLVIPTVVQIVFPTPPADYYETYSKLIYDLLESLNSTYIEEAINSISRIAHPFPDRADELKDAAYEYFNCDEVKTYYSNYISEKTFKAISEIIRDTNWRNQESLNKMYSTIKDLLRANIEIIK